jgi:glycosyltransferase involved in cell wall biosynthesis
MAKLLRMHAGRCSVAIANSASVAEDIRAACSGRIRVEKVWNAVDLKEFSPEGSALDLDAACGLPPAGDTVVRFGLVGTLAQWKGHDVFLRALAMLPAGLPVRGYIVGGPLYHTDASQWRLEDLKRMVAGLGLEGKVGFTGFLARPAEAMRALNVVVHASTKPEPFGLVIVEGMACGRAVIVSRAGGAAEFTTNGVNALAHMPGDAGGLARLMIRLAQDQELRERLSAAGRRTAERDFDRSRLGRQLAPIYESAVSCRSVRAA